MLGLKRALFAVVVFALLPSCGVHRTAPVMSRGVYTSTYFAPRFSAIDIIAPINVNLHTNSSRARVVIRANPHDRAKLVVAVKHDVLHVSPVERFAHHVQYDTTYTGPITVDIYTPSLRRLAVHGNVHLTGHRLVTRLMDASFDLDTSATVNLDGQIGLHELNVTGSGSVTIQGNLKQNVMVKMSQNPRVHLTGEVRLASVEASGRGFLSVYWVKSPTTIIRLHDAVSLQLAGFTHLLNVELWNDARFNGRYLRADRSFVRTHNHSRANISTIDRQHVVALDSSDIFLDELPVMTSDFMGHDGAVIDMRDIEAPRVRENTLYNK